MPPPGGLAHPQRARLLGIVGQRRGLHQPVAAGRACCRGGDAVVVRVAGQRRHDVRVGVEQRQGRRAARDLGQRLVGDDDHAGAPRRAASWAPSQRDLRGRQHAAGADVAAHGVEHDHAHRAPGVEGVVHPRAAAAVPAGRAQAGDRLARA